MSDVDIGESVEWGIHEKYLSVILNFAVYLNCSKNSLNNKKESHVFYERSL